MHWYNLLKTHQEYCSIYPHPLVPLLGNMFLFITDIIQMESANVNYICL